MNAKPIHIIGLGIIILSQVLLACSSTPTQSTPTASLTPVPLLATSTLMPTLTQVRPTRTPNGQMSFGGLSTPTKPRITATPTATIVRPTSTATLIPTPVATLVAHTWQPSTVIIYFDERGGDGEPGIYPPYFVVYADGRAFATKPFLVNDEWQIKLLSYQFSDSELCQLLNTIDQAGFFDYDPGSYNPNDDYLPIDGASNTNISVSAWRSNSVSLYGLRPFIEMPDFFACLDCPALPTILPALRNTFTLFDSYPRDNWELYQPERLGLWIYGRDEFTRNSEQWPLENPTLEELFFQTSHNTDGPPQSVVLRGEAAKDVYKLFDNSMDSIWLTDGTYRYGVYARPLLPYELPPGPGQYYPEIPAPIFPTPAYSLTCQPSDGILEIPIRQ